MTDPSKTADHTDLALDVLEKWALDTDLLAGLRYRLRRAEVLASRVSDPITARLVDASADVSWHYFDDALGLNSVTASAADSRRAVLEHVSRVRAERLANAPEAAQPTFADVCAKIDELRIALDGFSAQVHALCAAMAALQPKHTPE